MASHSPAGVEMSMKKSVEIDDGAGLALVSPEGGEKDGDLDASGTPFTPRSTTSMGRMKDALTDFMTDVVNSEEIFPWINVLLIAGVIGCVEYIPAALLGWGIPTRLNFLNKMYEDYGFYAQVLCAIGTSIGLVSIAAVMGMFLPSTKGSGLPHIIAYLSNGKMPAKGHFSVETVFGKIISVCAAIGGGLAIGREGPAIHIGAALGAITNDWIEQARAWLVGGQVVFDGHIKSNVVMMGSAAGFASAFRAPIGGFMYIVEELAIHWNIEEHTQVGAHMFFAVAIASFVTNAIVQATSDAGTIDFNSIIIYDHSTSEVFSDVYKYNDIPWFLMTAALCGVFGGLYCRVAIFINTQRADNPHYKLWYVRLLDCVIVAAVTATVLCALPMIYSTCEKNPDYYSATTDDHRRRLGGAAGSRNYNQHSCDYKYYSPMASLSLSGEEAVIRHLLSRDAENFGLPTLLVFLIFYVPLTLIVMGLPVACGTFVPNLLLGSLLGRIMGEIAAASNDNVSLPGVYALIGAGSLLGAWTRTMLAIVITIVEISGDVGVVLPLVVCSLIARGIANHISHHSYTHFNFYRLLDADPHQAHAGFMHPNDWVPVVAEAVGKGSGDRRISGIERPAGRASAIPNSNEDSQLDGEEEEGAGGVVYTRARRRSSAPVEGEPSASQRLSFDGVGGLEEGQSTQQGHGHARPSHRPTIDESRNEPLVVD